MERGDISRGPAAEPPPAAAGLPCVFEASTAEASNTKSSRLNVAKDIVLPCLAANVAKGEEGVAEWELAKDSSALSRASLNLGMALKNGGS